MEVITTYKENRIEKQFIVKGKNIDVCIAKINAMKEKLHLDNKINSVFSGITSHNN